MKDIVRVDKAPAPMLLFIVAIAAAQETTPPAEDQPSAEDPPSADGPPSAEEKTPEDEGVVVHPVGSSAVALGLEKVPVGRDELISARELVLSERAVLSNWLVPGHDVGLSGDWAKGLGRVRVGVFNGNGSILGDDNL